MLVLTRKKGEEVWINKGQIRIRVIYKGRGAMALGIQAPADIDVDRKEIYLRKQASAQVEQDKE